jgi:transcriptional regulator of arginine metabolism
MQAVFIFMRQDRHQVILDLISTLPISRQDELARLLTEHGFSVTQASVSRDLEKLGVLKINGRYAKPNPAARFGSFGPISFREAGSNLIVIKCGAGLASAAAVRIDAAAIPEIVGTIAGDDTIFVAVEGEKELARALKSLRSALERGEGHENN